MILGRCRRRRHMHVRLRSSRKGMVPRRNAAAPPPL